MPPLSLTSRRRPPEPPAGSNTPHANEVLGRTSSHLRDASDRTAVPCFCPQAANRTWRPPGRACGKTWEYPLAAPSGLVSDSGVPPVKAGLEKLASDTGADEVIVVTDTYEHADRLHSYERVAGVARMIRSEEHTS